MQKEPVKGGAPIHRPCSMTLTHKRLLGRTKQPQRKYNYTYFVEIVEIIK